MAGTETVAEYETDNGDLLLSLGMSVCCKDERTDTHKNTHRDIHPSRQLDVDIYPTKKYIHSYRALVWAVTQHGVRAGTSWIEWQLVDRIWHIPTLPQRLKEAQCRSARLLSPSLPPSRSLPLKTTLTFCFLHQLSLYLFFSLLPGRHRLSLPFSQPCSGC